MSELVLEKSIPKNWTRVIIDEISVKEKGSIRMGPFGSQLKKHELVDDGIRVLWIENIVNNKFEYKKGKFITKTKFEKLKGFSVKPNDILVTMMGTIGRTCVVPEDIGQAIISSHLLKITPQKELIDSKFLTYLLRGDQKILKQIESKARGVVMKGLNTKIIKFLEFSLPPLNEQKRIVEKIEELFSKLEYTQKNLENIKEKLKQHRQSLLKSIFEGELTQKWRTENKVLDSRNRWNLNIESINDESLPKIPNNWCWRTLEQISNGVVVSFVGPTSKHYVKENEGIMFLRSQNVRKGKINFQGMKYVDKKFHEKEKKSQIKPTNLLIVRVGANRGDSCIVPNSLPVANAGNIIIARVFEDISSLLNYYFQN